MSIAAAFPWPVVTKAAAIALTAFAAGVIGIIIVSGLGLIATGGFHFIVSKLGPLARCYESTLVRAVLMLKSLLSVQETCYVHV